MSQPQTGLDELTVIAPGDGHVFDFGDVGGRWKIGGADTDERFAVAHLPSIPPGTLGAPLHRHHDEDEYTCGLEGTLSVQVGDEVVTAEPGTWVFKPRGEWHTFWNNGERNCRIIEIVSPAGFESYFDEVAPADADPESLAENNARYSIEMDFDSVPELCEEYGLTFPEP